MTHFTKTEGCLVFADDGSFRADKIIFSAMHIHASLYEHLQENGWKSHDLEINGWTRRARESFPDGNSMELITAEVYWQEPDETARTQHLIEVTSEVFGLYRVWLVAATPLALLHAVRWLSQLFTLGQLEPAHHARNENQAALKQEVEKLRQILQYPPKAQKLVTT